MLVFLKQAPLLFNNFSILNLQILRDMAYFIWIGESFMFIMP